MFKLRLSRQGLVAYEPRTATTVRLEPEETESFLGRSIPFTELDEFAEVVHLEIAARCQLGCTYCYARDRPTTELSTNQWKAVISDLAGYGVLQITFGGGEPTLREDLKELALHARRAGLNLAMTTNGLKLPELGPDILGLFNQVNVSYHGDEHLLWQALWHLDANKIPRGINFLATAEYLPCLPFIALFAEMFDAELLLLTAKGIESAPGPEAAMAEARKLHEQGIRVAVDGLTCSGEMPDYCMQKRRFCTIDAAGNVLPCSFIRKPIGNLLKQPFTEIWRSRGEQVPCPFVKGDRDGAGEDGRVQPSL
jgi:hypothetical protein